jgi:ketosteroid isomerase-like protein
MSQENVEVVCDQFAATNERDFPRAMSHYAEDVELVVDPEAFLDAGTFKGRHAIGQWFGNWFATFEPGYHFDVEEARDLGDVVLLVASHHGRGRNSGVEVHGRTDTSTRFAAARLSASSFIRTAPKRSTPPGCDTSSDRSEAAPSKHASKRAWARLGSNQRVSRVRSRFGPGREPPFSAREAALRPCGAPREQHRDAGESARMGSDRATRWQALPGVPPSVRRLGTQTGKYRRAALAG